MTERPYTIGLYVLRCYESGLRIADLEELDEGMVLDMLTEAANDQCEYRELASQEDMDRF